MSALSPFADDALDAPVPVGTSVALESGVAFHGRDFVAGGSPWRLLRLSGRSRAVAERWRAGDVVRPGEERFARTLIQQGLLLPHFTSDPNLDDIDIVIPVKDDVAALRSLLTQLRGLHVTVVDDGSRSATLLAECARGFGVNLVRLEQNRGPGAARNAGIRATSRPLIWFLDVDIEVDDAPDLARRLQSSFNDPLVGAVAPRIRGSQGGSLRDHFEERFSPLDMGERSGLVVPGGTVGYVPSACLFVRRSAIGTGFDQTLRVGEDVDLVWRLHDRGWLVRFDADATALHRARASWPEWWRQRVRYGESASYLAARHGERLAPLRSDAWTLVAWASALTRSPLLGVRIVRVARDRLRGRLDESGGDGHEVATSVVGRAMVRAGGPLARAVVRTYGPLLLVAALHPTLRRRALAVFALGTAWRWRHRPVHLADIPLAVADDLSYSCGVAQGAWQTRSLRALTPSITTSSIRLRDVLGVKDRPSRAQ